MAMPDCLLIFRFARLFTDWCVSIAGLDFHDFFDEGNRNGALSVEIVSEPFGVFVVFQFRRSKLLIPEAVRIKSYMICHAHRNEPSPFTINRWLIHGDSYCLVLVRRFFYKVTGFPAGIFLISSGNCAIFPFDMQKLFHIVQIKIFSMSHQLYSNFFGVTLQIKTFRIISLPLCLPFGAVDLNY